MGVEQKSVAFLIDSLVTTLMRCWFSQEDIMDKSLSTEARLAAAVRAQEMNGRRNALMRAIDERLGEGHLSPSKKTYYTYTENET